MNSICKYSTASKVIRRCADALSGDAESGVVLDKALALWKKCGGVSVSVEASDLVVLLESVIKVRNENVVEIGEEGNGFHTKAYVAE
tara:strand:+ start:172 stop:432 length:261 start_codon:yes stop_codon:yes gene_type:complete